MVRAVVIRGICLLAVLFLCVGCSGSGAGDGAGNPSLAVAGIGNVRASWTPNRETAVNSPGGGYRIYYASTRDFALDRAAGVIDVPYASGALAPTSTLLTLPSGTHYLKIVAYSTLNPSGSEASAEIPVAVP